MDGAIDLKQLAAQMLQKGTGKLHDHPVIAGGSTPRTMGSPSPSPSEQASSRQLPPPVSQSSLASPAASPASSRQLPPPMSQSSVASPVASTASSDAKPTPWGTEEQRQVARELRREFSGSNASTKSSTRTRGRPVSTAKTIRSSPASRADYKFGATPDPSTALSTTSSSSVIPRMPAAHISQAPSSTVTANRQGGQLAVQRPLPVSPASKENAGASSAGKVTPKPLPPHLMRSAAASPSTNVSAATLPQKNKQGDSLKSIKNDPDESFIKVERANEAKQAVPAKTIKVEPASGTKGTAPAKEIVSANEVKKVQPVNATKETAPVKEIVAVSEIKKKISELVKPESGMPVMRSEAHSDLPQINSGHPKIVKSSTDTNGYKTSANNDSELAQAKTELADAKGQVVKSNDELNVALKTIAKLNDELADAKGQVVKSNDELNAALKTIAKLNDRVAELEKSYFEIAAKVERIVEKEECRRYLGTQDANSPFTVAVLCPGGVMRKVQGSGALSVADFIRRTRFTHKVTAQESIAEPQLLVGGKAVGHSLKLHEVNVLGHKEPTVEFVWKDSHLVDEEL